MSLDTDQVQQDTTRPQRGETVRIVVGDLTSERVIRAVHRNSDGTTTLEFED